MRLLEFAQCSFFSPVNGMAFAPPPALSGPLTHRSKWPMQSLAALLYLVLLTPAIALKPCAEEVPEPFIAYANSSSSAVDRLVGRCRRIGAVSKSKDCRAA